MNAAPPRNPSQPPRSRAFSLTEVLVVISVVVLLTTATVPALNGLRGAASMTEAAYQMATVMEQARAHAMAQGTSVYVGIAEEEPDAAGRAGVGNIVLTAFAVRGGTSTFDNASEVAAITKPILIPRVALDPDVPTSGNLDRDAADAVVAASSFPSLPAALTNGNRRFSAAVRFDPQGSAWPSSSRSYANVLEIGLRPTRGNQALANSTDLAAIQIDGVTGAVRVFRP